MSSARSNYSIFFLKPGYNEKQLQIVDKYLASNAIKVLARHKQTLSRSDVIALYPFIYNKIQDESGYFQWKIDTLTYLTSGESLIFLLEKTNSYDKIKKLKIEIRRKYGKIRKPRKELDRTLFIKKTIQNIVHQVEPNEIPTAIWILFPDLID